MKVTIKPSTRYGKRYMAEFSNGIVTHFGSAFHENYTLHKDPERKERYIARHSKENWEDPYSAGALSRWILWNKPTLRASIADYKKRFGFS